ncbi:hypothetical protein JOC85_000377 [Bacillus mesophilus]|uniref:DUF1850 domain-containing protein n=1 Tax=Bacillus mesophilus TaxID=1808955 RepID=A0A6M0Q3Y5_9BACI|nr:DUF1850 domain-containing protein [Bacillus mesophilus]MBM7659610.1 hypothetical protein [Bacillus mesophilus]NEY70479.1 DUF1850 domain-containing protein [Bacillus mesophilus]
MKKGSLLVGMIIICLLILLVPYKDSLVFEKGNSGKTMVYYPKDNLQTFQILYTHSIHLSEVVEIYEISLQNDIIQTGLIYEDYAIGMPSGPAEGEKFKLVDGKMHITNMKRRFPYLDIRIGQVVANHQLVIAGTTYKLGEYVPPGSWVRVNYRKLNNLQILKGVNLHE